MADYKYLFTPLKLGPIVLKNRIVCAAHGLQAADPVTFMVTERAKAYYEEKAKGGAALVVLTSSSVDEHADYFPANNFAFWSDDIIPGLRELVEICHKYDCKFFAQPSHPGVHNICHVQVDEVPLGPSQVPGIEVPNQIPKELSIEEIWEIQEKFVKAVERCVKAGVDGVELMCAHDKLPWAFVSALSNKRTDEYGGSLENRARFMLEVVHKVRARVGRDVPIGIRMNVNELEPGGLDIEDGIKVVKMFEATGLLDWIGTVNATYKSIAFELSPFAAGFEPGWAGEFSRKVKAEVKLPVAVAAKINDPGLADRMIAEGKCDYVYIARALIADPHFPRKAMEGREEDITPCIYCNQGCVARSFNRATTNGIRCTVNPAAGDEVRWGSWTFEKAARRKQVLIAGAGPAGLECAMVAAQRGHAVTVYEKETEAGGQARLIKRILDHTMPQTFLDYLENQVRKLGVKIHFGAEITEATIDEVLAKEKPDVVIVATGARPARDGRGSITTEPIPGWDKPHVVTYLDILLGTAEPGRKVLIVDELADRITPGIAEMLAEEGKEVEVITRWECLSPNLRIWLDEPYAMGRLDELGVKITPNSWVKAIDQGSVECFNIHSGREFAVTADTVVLATMKYSNVELVKLLKERNVECHLIGDARAPRWILTATHDGYKMGREL